MQSATPTRENIRELFSMYKHYKLNGSESMDGQKVYDIRMKLGVSQERLAQLIGATASTVCRWENGHTVPNKFYLRELRTLVADHELQRSQRDAGDES